MAKLPYHQDRRGYVASVRKHPPMMAEYKYEKDGGNAPAKGDGGRLTAKERQALPRAAFALPGKGTGPKGAGAGSYPIPDASHARNALARVSQHGNSGEKAAVRAKVSRKFPGIGGRNT